jgi:hypothetical protein
MYTECLGLAGLPDEWREETLEEPDRGTSLQEFEPAMLREAIGFAHEGLWATWATIWDQYVMSREIGETTKRERAGVRTEEPWTSKGRRDAHWEWKRSSCKKV